MAIDYKEWNERKNLLRENHWIYVHANNDTGRPNSYLKEVYGGSVSYPVAYLKSMSRAKFEEAISE